MSKKQKQHIFVNFRRLYLHHASPAFRRRLIGILAFLVFFNGSVWLCILLSMYRYPLLPGLVILAYTLGLRHAVDADHIAAIDNATRKLMQEGKRPVAVGFFFSMGHSTIVILLSTVITFSAAFMKNNLAAFENIGRIIGTSVSSLFLFFIGIVNFTILLDIFKIWRKVTKKGIYEDYQIEKHLNKQGVMVRFLKPFLKAISNSRNMYVVGFLFGLGFDTASEVGLLSISATTGGMPFINIILLPLAFTAGMSLIDTLDGILMLYAYGWAYLTPIQKLYYNMAITCISIIIALFIGGIEGMQVLISQLKLYGDFFDSISKLDFGSLGYIVIFIFIVGWLLSMGIYKIKGYAILDKKK